ASLLCPPGTPVSPKGLGAGPGWEHEAEAPGLAGNMSGAEGVSGLHGAVGGSGVGPLKPQGSRRSPRLPPCKRRPCQRGSHVSLVQQNKQGVLWHHLLKKLPKAAQEQIKTDTPPRTSTRDILSRFLSSILKIHNTHLGK
uniref:Uncharacterized protein n=1 Tax=Pelusios castaneus TaxID=367368 RepID=A0A8C8SI36_9SAUR